MDLGLMMGGRIFPEDKNKRQVFECVCVSAFCHMLVTNSALTM